MVHGSGAFFDLLMSHCFPQRRVDLDLGQLVSARSDRTRLDGHGYMLAGDLDNHCPRQFGKPRVACRVRDAWSPDQAFGYPASWWRIAETTLVTSAASNLHRSAIRSE